MGEKFVNATELAQILGVSRQAVFYAAERGTLVRRPDKRFSLQNAVNRDYIEAARSRKRAKADQKKMDLQVTQAQAEQKSKSIEQQTNVSSGDVISLNNNQINKAEAERRKTIEQVEELKIKNWRARHQLLERNLVEKVFYQLYQIDVNRLRTLPARLSSPISAAAKIDDPAIVVRIEEIVNDEIFKVLGEVKRVFDNFLSSVRNSNNNGIESINRDIKATRTTISGTA